MNSAKTIPAGFRGIWQLFASSRAKIRPQRVEKATDSPASPTPGKEDRYLRLRHELLGVQRKSLLDLFKRGAICTDVYCRLLHELDVEETSLSKAAHPKLAN